MRIYIKYLLQIIKLLHRIFKMKAGKGGFFFGKCDSFAEVKKKSDSSDYKHGNKNLEDIINDLQMKEISLSNYSVYYHILKSKPKKILDLGGGYGQHYFDMFKRNNDIYGYYIAELSEVVSCGDEIVKETKNNNLYFISDIQEAKDIDCLLCIGSINYIEKNFTDLLDSLINLPKMICINNLFSTDNHKTFVTSQIHGGGK